MTSDILQWGHLLILVQLISTLILHLNSVILSLPHCHANHLTQCLKPSEKEKRRYSSGMINCEVSCMPLNIQLYFWYTTTICTGHFLKKTHSLRINWTKIVIGDCAVSRWTESHQDEFEVGPDKSHIETTYPHWQWKTWGWQNPVDNGASWPAEHSSRTSLAMDRLRTHPLHMISESIKDWLGLFQLYG